MLVQSPVVRRLYCYLLCLGQYSCCVLCLGQYYCYVSNYCGSVLSYCPVVCLVCGLCVSLCNGRELLVVRNYQCYAALFYNFFVHMFVDLWCKDFSYDFDTIHSG